MAGGHFGGSWKIAYGDFITSMFALFLVLWIMSFDELTKRAVEQYFRGRETQVIQGQRGILPLTDKGVVRTDPVEKASKDILSISPIQKALEDVRDQLKSSSTPGDDNIRFEFNSDGVRITAFDNDTHPLYQPGSQEMTPYGAFIMRTLGTVLERLPVHIEVEGHVQKSEGDPDASQLGWQLSTMRAVSAQSALNDGGVHTDQYFRVAGYSDTKPIDPNDPSSNRNRRIEIMVRPNDHDAVQEIRTTLQNP